MNACEMFTCPHHVGNLRLTPQACAQNWKRARKAEPWDALRVCRGCEIGAGHAGETPAPQAPSARECLRCGGTDKRLVRGQICISCYNRERELLTGRYRRTVPPQGLRVTQMQVLLAGRLEPLPVQVASITEALLVAARRQPGTAILAAATHCPPWNAACQQRPPQTSFLPGA
jgi:hypothetical protein